MEEIPLGELTVADIQRVLRCAQKRERTASGRHAFGQVKLAERRQTLPPHIDDRPPRLPDFASSRAEHSHRSAEAIRFESLELLQGGDPADREIP
jgi:hypothetical protein